MQTVVFNAVMAKRDQENISLPPELTAFVDSLVARYGVKRRWAVYVASLVAFMEVGRERQDELVREVVGARTIPGEMAKLVVDRTGDPVGAPPIPPRGQTPPPPEPPAQGRTRSPARAARGTGRAKAK